MAQQIVIDPVTRIEGHAKITIHLDDQGQVEQTRFHVTEFRGFEQFCVGRPLWEMPSITGRICGICPISHILASAKAGDEILAVEIPVAAEKLRRLMNLGQIVQSHALSFFHLSSPDLLFGMESDPAQRNVFGLMAANPELARGGIRLRQFGQRVIELLGGKRIHPAWAVPGGVRSGLTAEGVAEIRGRLDEALTTTLTAITLFKTLLAGYADEVHSYGNFPSYFMSLVGEDGTWEHYDGPLCIIDQDGAVVARLKNHAEYQTLLGEAVETWSYLKFPYYRGAGYPDGCYRVGPLARLNIASRMGTPLADQELAVFREQAGAPARSSFFYHYARLIEILTALERISVMLDDPDLVSGEVRAKANVNRLEGVGVSEAPRGTLFHHYQVDRDGLLKQVNLIISTGQNNLAMNRTVNQIAQRYIAGPQVPEGILNRLEAGIRAYDPCLSCSTHALGQMPLQVQLLAADGSLLDEVRR